MTTRFPFSSFPSGWFRVGTSDDLAREAVRPLRYFGQDLVMFRTRAGVVHVLDAHCPHLGAHLGHGGRVRGDTIECPFHGWRIDGQGRCASVPNAKQQVPQRPEIPSWPVRECNGMIMVYHHPQRKAPDWEFPGFAEYEDPEWTPYHAGRHWRIRTHVQEVNENGMDLAHVAFVHHQHTLSAETESLEVDGPFLVHHASQRYHPGWLAKLWVREADGPLDIHCYGLGATLTRTVVRARLDLHYSLAFFHTPIDEEHIEVTSMASMKKLSSGLMTRLLLRRAIREGGAAIDQDVPIWENKRYRAKPGLMEGEGPIMEYRRWASQFYPGEGLILLRRPNSVRGAVA